MSTPCAPKISLQQLAERGTANLNRVIAIDSQSDERSSSIPSSQGQRRLSEDLAAFFGGLGFATSSDGCANLLVEIPATPGVDAPKLAFMIHMDTARGTQAVSALSSIERWDGGRVPYRDNPTLEVSVAQYPETAPYVGEQLLFGPGKFPIGLDDKLGLAELMTMAQTIAEEPELPHGEIVIACRPDEEIGRMQAVEGLAEIFAERGVRCGYTVDGLGPFEVQSENFEASRASVIARGAPLQFAAPCLRAVSYRIEGCKSHGATAKAEGYRNANVLLCRALADLGQPKNIVPVRFHSDADAETDADVTLLLGAADTTSLDATEAQLTAALEAQIRPHGWRGASLRRSEQRTLTAQQLTSARFTDATARLLQLVSTFIASSDGPIPILSEESEGRQGYSNPYSIEPVDGGGARLDFRLRAFDPAELAERAAHAQRHARALGLDATVEQQYHNMGPALAPYPELTRWAQAAAEAIGVRANICPIRGGTGVDPFLAKGIPIANLGTGYFAPESEKEFTSREKIAQHTLWLLHLVQLVR